MAEEAKKYAQIKEGKIVNIIVLEDESLEPLFREGFDELKKFEEFNEPPKIGSEFDGEKYAEPVIDFKSNFKIALSNIHFSLMEALAASKYFPKIEEALAIMNDETNELKKEFSPSELQLWQSIMAWIPTGEK